MVFMLGYLGLILDVHWAYWVFYSLFVLNRLLEIVLRDDSENF